MRTMVIAMQRAYNGTHMGRQGNLDRATRHCRAVGPTTTTDQRRGAIGSTRSRDAQYPELISTGGCHATHR